MNELLEKIFAKNVELGFQQTLDKGPIPESLLMIDQKTRRPVSRQLEQLYSFATKWTEGLFGLNLADPSLLQETYTDQWLSEVLQLTSENYHPIPPSDTTDWERTALLASESGGMGLLLCWWENEGAQEPAIVLINGGTIRVFATIQEMVEFAANGTFPEMGDKLYASLEEARGTLSS